MIFPANLWTGTKHTAFSIYHLADTDKTEQKYSKEQKNPNNNAR